MVDAWLYKVVVDFAWLFGFVLLYRLCCCLYLLLFVDLLFVVSGCGFVDRFGWVF